MNWIEIYVEIYCVCDKRQKRECMMRTLYRLCSRGSTVVWMVPLVVFSLLSESFVVHDVTFAFLVLFASFVFIIHFCIGFSVNSVILNWIRLYVQRENIFFLYHFYALLVFYLKALFRDAFANTLHGTSDSMNVKISSVNKYLSYK